MDLQQEWNSLNETMNNDTLDFSADQLMIRKTSIGAYETLRKNLRYKMLWAWAISLLVAVLAVIADAALRYLMLATSICFIIPAITMYIQMKSLPVLTDYTEVTRTVLNTQLQHVNKILKMERSWSYIFMPVSPFLGCMAYILMKNNDFNAILAYQKWAYMVPVGIILSIGGIYIAGRMNQYSFGPYLKKMNDNITALKD